VPPRVTADELSADTTRLSDHNGVSVATELRVFKTCGLSISVDQISY
jgi:hypothetical protein